MKKRNAFTLFELTIYMGIFALFSILSFGYFSKIYRKVFIQMKEDKFFIRNNIILDTLKRDVLAANSSIINWNESDFVFRTKNVLGKTTDISWQFRKDGVFRLIGKYDFQQRKWLKKNSAKLDFNNINFNFWLLKDKKNHKVKFVKIVLSNEVFLMSLKNKIFVL